MLSKSESKIMGVLYRESKDKNALLISPTDLTRLAGDKTLTKRKVERLVEDLCSDGYFDLVYSDRRGERVYCVTLTKKGKGYLRDIKMFKRNLVTRFILSVAFAVLSFLIGLILRALF